MTQVYDFSRRPSGGRSSYTISLVGLLIILSGGMVAGYYLLSYGEEVVFFLAKLATISMVLMLLGIMVGGVNVSFKFNAESLLYGIIGFAVLMVVRIVVGYTLSLDRLVVFLAAIFEELGFRFGLQRFLERVVGPYIAIIVQASVFMIYHWLVYPGFELISIFPLIGGLVLGTVYWLSRDLSASLIAHVLNNLF